MNISARRIDPQAEEDLGPLQLRIPGPKDVFVGELAEPGEWIVANVQSDSFWPVNAQKVMYRGEAFWIVPVMKDYFPAVAMKVPKGKSRAACEKSMMRFLSNLSWVEERGILIDGLGGGSRPMPLGREKRRGFSICEEFDLSYFPEPASDRALLALALMREGRGLNHPAYAFLSFFRVLEVVFPDDKKRKAWISANVSLVRGHRVPEALAELQAKGISDIGTHLYESGRCAVAHASRKPIIDPDDPSDMRRMWSELPIMMALAQNAIEEKLGVETRQTVYRKHLYELAGFKQLLGADTVDRIARSEQITDERLIDIPEISVRIRRREPYEPLSNLSVRQLGQNGKLVYMRFESKSGDVVFRLQLDFGTERLNFSLFDDLAVADLGSAASAERIAEVRRFQNEYFGNGQLHIVNANTDELIGRKDAYIPINMFLDHEAADAEVARWEHLAAIRREFDQRYAEALARDAIRYEMRTTVSFTELLK